MTTATGRRFGRLVTRLARIDARRAELDARPWDTRSDSELEALLCESLGYPVGTPLPDELLEAILDGSYYESDEL